MTTNLTSEQEFAVQLANRQAAATIAAAVAAAVIGHERAKTVEVDGITAAKMAAGVFNVILRGIEKLP